MNRLIQAFRVLLHGDAEAGPRWIARRDDGAGIAADRHPPVTPAPAGEPEQSPMTEDLMALRDDVLAAADNPDQPTERVLAAVARKLDRILLLDQVEAFEDSGKFDPDRQQVVDTIETTDPESHYTVASSVRPGYLRAGALLRRQDVILYRLPALAGPRPS